MFRTCQHFDRQQICEKFYRQDSTIPSADFQSKEVIKK